MLITLICAVLMLFILVWVGITIKTCLDHAAKVIQTLIKLTAGDSGDLKLFDKDLIFKEFLNKHEPEFGSESPHWTYKAQIPDFDDALFWSHATGWQRFCINHGPSAMVAAGIIGTFIGIIIGIANIDLNSGSELLRQGIGELVNGLSVAFVSSLIGVFGSVVLILVRSTCLAKLEHGSSSLRRALIEKEKLLVPEVLLHKINQEMQATNSALKCLNDTAQDQSEKLGTMASDIASQVTEELGSRMSSIITEELAPQLTAIQHGFDEFASGQIADQSEALSRVVQSFVEQLQSKLHDHFEELATALQRTWDWYENIRGLYGDLSQKLEQQLETQQAQREQEAAFFEKLSEDLNRLTDIRDKLAEVEQGLLTRLTNSLEKTRLLEHHVQDALEQVQGSTQLIADGLERHQNFQRSVLTQVDSISRSFQESNKTLEEVGDRFRNNVDMARKDLGEGLSTTFGTFDKESARVVSHLTGTFTMLNQSVQTLESTVQHMEKQLKTLQNTLDVMPRKVAESFSASSPMNTSTTRLTR